MNLDLQVEGSRIADELKHLQEPQGAPSPPPVSGLFVLAVKGMILAIGLVITLVAALFLDLQLAFITITCTSLATLGLLIGGRKIARSLSGKPISQREK